jgi:glycine cleavage system H lipoate-binding protein
MLYSPVAGEVNALNSLQLKDADVLWSMKSGKTWIVRKN